MSLEHLCGIAYSHYNNEVCVQIFRNQKFPVP